MKTDVFQSCGHCWVFQICWPNECSTFTASSSRIWNSSTGMPSPPLACSQWCFLRPTWLHIPVCLALGEWLHHCYYLPGASVRNPTHDKVMRRGLMGKASQASGFPPGISWACTPKIRICLPYCTVLFHYSDTLWKKLTQGFSLLHLKGMFQFKPPLITL